MDPKGLGNMSFQTPARSLSSQALSRAGSSGFGVSVNLPDEWSHLTGHVTPTSGFQPIGGIQQSPVVGGSSSVFPPQPISPNRGLQSLAMGARTPIGPVGGVGLSAGLFGQRGFPERRSVPGLPSTPLGAMSNFSLVQSSRIGSQGPGGLSSTLGGFPNLLVGGGGETSPPLLDLSEFPSLTNRGQGDSIPQPSPLPTKPYGMVKQPTSESSEFQMSSEDFPALPGTQTPEGSVQQTNQIMGGEKVNNDNSQDLSMTENGPTSRNTLEKMTATRRGIHTSPDGKVSNIPVSMVKDQFGMVGLLTFIRAAETDPNLVSLALGSDLTALGLNLNSTDNLYPNFGGPWAETPCRPQDIDCHVPPEYLVNSAIREKLAQVKLNRYKEDLLFYMFYTNVGDVLQVAAAAELFSRDWRYHKDEKVWLTRPPGMVPAEKTSTYERGTYYIFDVTSWRKVVKDFHLDYDKLEDRPHLPSQVIPTPPSQIAPV